MNCDTVFKLHAIEIIWSKFNDIAEPDPSFQTTFMVCAGLELLGGYQGLHRQLMSARSSQEADASQSEALKEACECLGSWRRLLISQLPDIYPITQVRLAETV